MENHEKTPDTKTEIDLNSDTDMKNHEEKPNSNTEVDLNNDISKEDYAAAIKCVFSGTRNILKGAFCILLRKHDLKIVELIFWATKSISNEELIPSMTWEDFSTKIPSIGPINKEICIKLQQTLKNELSQETIKNIFVENEANESNVIPFGSKIRELFEEKLHYMIKLDFEFEPFSRARLRSTGYEREEAPSDTNTENMSMTQILSEQTEKQAIICTAIVDPVNGIAVSELRIGDLVEVVFPANNTIGLLLSDYYAKLKKTPVYPIKEIRISDNGKHTIDLEADGGITCIVKMGSSLKLRAKKGYMNKNPLSGRTFMIIAGFSATLLILLLIVLLILLMK